MIQPTSSAFGRYTCITGFALSAKTVHALTTTLSVERYADITAKWGRESAMITQDN